MELLFRCYQLQLCDNKRKIAIGLLYCNAKTERAKCFHKILAKTLISGQLLRFPSKMMNFCITFFPFSVVRCLFCCQMYLSV
jgi:hypothetical protein